MLERNARVGVISLIVGIAGITSLIMVWDGTPPDVAIEQPFDIVGVKTPLVLHIDDMESGLKRVTVSIMQGSETYPLVNREFQGPRWYRWWKRGPERSFDLEVAPYADRAIPYRDGTARLMIIAEDYAVRPFFGSNERSVTHEFRAKFIPPRLERLSASHVINQGGAELVVYRVSDDAVRHGVELGARFFPGYAAPNGERSFAMLAFPYSESRDIPIFLVAEDEAGNVAKSPVPYDLIAHTWRKRDIAVDDRFIQQTVQPLIARTPEIQEQGDLLKDFLEVNITLRRITEERIVEIAQKTQPGFLWSGAFHQLSNSKVEALFADRRDYYYNGKVVDTQDHLGYDLATRKRYPVEASNAGVVVYAEHLGLYGNAVVLDHGYGLQSLYGHLSSFTVTVGQKIEKGQVIGYTGSTGMAGGDHLHFSMLLHGHQVNPIEWWDERWVRVHVEDRIRRAQPTVTPGSSKT